MTVLVIPERVLRRVTIYAAYHPSGDCLHTLYSTGSHGYGQVGWQESGKLRATTTHRAAWTAANGPIPEGMTVDHICRVRTCQRIDHLRLLTMQENAADNGQVRTGLPTGKPCRNGHAKLMTPSGRVVCNECANARDRARRQRDRDSGLVRRTWGRPPSSP